MPHHRVTFLAATALGLGLLSPRLPAQQPTASRPGGPGALGANLLALVTHPAVQAELKLTEDQKAQLKALDEKDDERRLRWLESLGLGRPNAAGNRAEGQAGGGGAPPDESGRSGRRRGGRAAQTGPTGRLGGRSANRSPDAESQDPFVSMLESRQRIQQATERSIARILTPAQYARARQIQLQVEGTPALLQPEMQERLFLGEDQVAQIRELMQERQRALRETRDARNSLRQAALDHDPTLSRLNEHLAQNVPPPSRDPLDDGAPRNGRDGGAGRLGNDPAYREARIWALRKFDEDRASQEQMAAIGAEDERIERRFQAALHQEVLTRRQSQAYRAMLGAPFDLARHPGGANGGRGGGGTVVNRVGPSDAKAGGNRAASPTSAAEASGQPGGRASAIPKRRSLREQRGLDTVDDRR